MRIIDLLSTDRIALGAQISDKEQAIDKLVELQMAGRRTEKRFWQGKR